jgi:hypothetical protein
MNLLTPTLFASLGILGATFAGPPSATPVKTKKVPTFAKDVAPIIYSKCAGCHRAGEVAPFTLTSYQDAKSKALTIASVVKQKYMPPWSAAGHGEFTNERTLSTDQIATLSAWADAGAPAGDLTKAPPPPAFTKGWKMGTPEFVGAPDRPYAVTADGSDDYRCFIIPTNYPEDRYVTGIEVRPGNSKIVHHVLIYLDGRHAARKIPSTDGKPGFESFGGPGFAPTGSLGGWAPGLEPQILTPGLGFRLTKGADIVVQVHYHKDGKPETDLTRIGLKFASAPVDKRLRSDALGDLGFVIPPGAKDYPIHAGMTINRDVTVMDVIPHMHLLGKDMKVDATLPDGQVKNLITVDHYDYNWQTRYAYREPIHLPTGTRITLVAHYDNSTDNPKNPNNPPKQVTYGEHTTDEMCFAFFTYTLDSEHLTKGKSGGDNEDASDHRDELVGIFKQYDTDHDGYLDATELAALIAHFDGPAVKNPLAVAKGAIALFGHTVKDKVTVDEFLKMVAASSKG